MLMSLASSSFEVPVSSSSSVDPSLLELFRAELEVHLPTLSEGLLALEKGVADPKQLEVLMRAAHSIKGAAKIVGIQEAVRVAHVMEDCFVGAQEGRIALTSDAVDVLLRGVDVLPRVCPGGTDSPSETTLAALIDEIAAVRAGKTPKPLAPPQVTVPTVRPAGNLDATEAEALRLRLGELLQRGAPRIRLDLAAVGDVEPAGLAVLARAASAAARRSPPAAFELTNVTPTVRTLLRTTRLDEAFPIVDEGR
jgi:two-component system sensor histidine kinase and response regulator WspE